MLKLYTDGSCLGNPGKGGWCAICIGQNEVPIFKLCGAELNMTNNIMELTAVIKGLEKILDIGLNEVVVYTDSKYVSQGISVWISKWVNNNWRKSDGTSVKNKELWEKLYKINCEFKNIQWEWVKAHNGIKWNEEVDKMARHLAETI